MPRTRAAARKSGTSSAQESSLGPQDGDRPVEPNVKTPRSKHQLLAAQFEIEEAIGNAREIAGEDPQLQRELIQDLLLQAVSALRGMAAAWPGEGIQAARVLEGLQICLFENRSSSKTSRGATLSRCATALLRTGRRAASSLLIAPDEQSKIAVSLRAVIRAGIRRGRNAEQVALALEAERAANHGELVLPGPSSPAERIAKFRSAIAACQNFSSASLEEHSTRVLVACAKAAGFKRPSSLFQFEEKAEKRRPRRR